MTSPPDDRKRVWKVEEEEAGAFRERKSCLVVVHIGSRARTFGWKKTLNLALPHCAGACRCCPAGRKGFLNSGSPSTAQREQRSNKRLQRSGFFSRNLFITYRQQQIAFFFCGTRRARETELMVERSSPQANRKSNGRALFFL